MTLKLAMIDWLGLIPIAAKFKYALAPWRGSFAEVTNRAYFTFSIIVFPVAMGTIVILIVVDKLVLPVLKFVAFSVYTVLTVVWSIVGLGCLDWGGPSVLGVKFAIACNFLLLVFVAAAILSRKRVKQDEVRE